MYLTNGKNITLLDLAALAHLSRFKCKGNDWEKIILGREKRKNLYGQLSGNK